MRTLVVDAFDSFVYIIFQYLRTAGADATVVRANQLRRTDIDEFAPQALVLGPGPGHPAESGHVEIVREFAGRVPILGVCLGHQAIGMTYGAAVQPAEHLMHGKTSQIVHDGRGIFAGLPAPVRATRYHSLIVVAQTVPEQLVITARSRDDGYVMGLRHRSLPVESVQFHPESVTTEHGLRMFSNFLDRARRFRDCRREELMASAGSA